MRRWKRCAAAALCACLLLPAVTAHAATEETARVKRLSGDVLSGYYVVFEMNGHEYRTDLCGPSVNYGLWLRCGEQDKRDIMMNYAFSPGSRIQQFGYENSGKMCDWIDGDTGWKQARDVLADRLVERDFPKIWYFYDGEGSDYASRSDIGKNDYSFKNYDYLGEVRDYMELKQTMLELYNMGSSACYRLRDAKSYQTSIAVMSTCGDLISFIVERAMVPAITPGGLSALAPSIKGELQGLVDKLTGFSDKITEITVGKKLDATTAREIIDMYWEEIGCYQNMAEYCIDRFMDLKAKKSAYYEDAAQAIQDEMDAAAKNDDQARGDAGDLAMAEYDPAPASGTWGALAAQFDSTMDQFYAWSSSTFGSEEGSVRSAFETRLKNIERTFDAWPSGLEQDGMPPATYNMDKQSTRDAWMFGGRFAVWNLPVCSTGLPAEERWSHFSVLRTELPKAWKGCEDDLDGMIGKLDEYVEDYTTAMESIQEAWLSYESALKGLLDAMWTAEKGEDETYTLRYPASMPASLESDFQRFYNCCGRRQVGSSWLTLDDYKQYLEDQKKYYKTVRETFVQDCDAYEAELKTAADRYLGLQDQLAEDHARWLEAYNAHAALVEETEAIYYTADRKNEATGKQLLSDDLDIQFRRASQEDRAALMASWGQDLTQRLDKLDEYRLMAAKIKKERDQHLKELSGNLVLLNEVMGGGLKSKSDLEKEWNDLYDKDRSWTSEEMVRQACGEFTGSSAIMFLVDTSMEEAGWLKYNYLRGDESARSTISSRIGDLAHGVSDGMMAGGVRYERAFPYAYMLLRDPTRETLYGDLNKWAEEAKSYRPVTGLKGPASLMEDTGSHAMGVGAVWELGKLVSVAPSDATYKTLVWESDNIDVCTVDGNGRVTAVGSGTATIRVRALDSLRTPAVLEAEDAAVTFDPEPLTFTVIVGTGKETVQTRDGDVIWENYGTEEEPQFYNAFHNAGGTTSVSCALRKDTFEPMDIVVALYDKKSGKMLAASSFPREQDAGDFRFARTVPNRNGLILRAFSLSAGGGQQPRGLLLDVTIPKAGR